LKVKRAEAKKRRREKNRSLAGKLRDGREEFAGVGILRLLKDFFGGPVSTNWPACMTVMRVANWATTGKL